MLEIGAILGPARVQEEKRNDFVKFFVRQLLLARGRDGIFLYLAINASIYYCRAYYYT